MRIFSIVVALILGTISQAEAALHLGDLVKRAHDFSSLDKKTSQEDSNTLPKSAELRSTFTDQIFSFKGSFSEAGGKKFKLKEDEEGHPRTFSIRALIKPTKPDLHSRLIEYGGLGIGPGYSLEYRYDQKKKNGRIYFAYWRSKSVAYSVATDVRIPSRKPTLIHAVVERNSIDTTLKLYVNGVEQTNQQVRRSYPMQPTVPYAPGSPTRLTPQDLRIHVGQRASKIKLDGYYRGYLELDVIEGTRLQSSIDKDCKQAALRYDLVCQ